MVIGLTVGGLHEPIADHDRDLGLRSGARALTDGRVQVEGCDVNYITMPVEECFERAFFHGEFEVAEIGFSPYLIALSRGRRTLRRRAGLPVAHVPAFGGLYPHRSRYRRAGRPARQARRRARVSDVGGDVVPRIPAGRVRHRRKDINWVQAGLENPGRRDKFPLNLPDGFPLVPPTTDPVDDVGRRPLDAVMSARRPSCFVNGHPNIRRLFPDYRAAEREYYRTSGLFPDHACRRHPARRSREAPWLAASVYKAFLQAKRIADADFAETTALKIGLPWVTAEFEATRDVMGDGFLVLRRRAPTARRSPPWRDIPTSRAWPYAC